MGSRCSSRSLVDTCGRVILESARRRSLRAMGVSDTPRGGQSRLWAGTASLRSKLPNQQTPVRVSEQLRQNELGRAFSGQRLARFCPTCRCRLGEDEFRAVSSMVSALVSVPEGLETQENGTFIVLFFFQTNSWTPGFSREEPERTVWLSPAAAAAVGVTVWWRRPMR